MKRIFVTSLSILSLLTIVTPSLALDMNNNGENDNLNKEKIALNSMNNSFQINPANLVSIGYQGFLDNQGIPNGYQFMHQIKTGEITAEKLIQSAIANGRLSSNILNDEEYINVVEFQLNTFIKNN